MAGSPILQCRLHYRISHSLNLDGRKVKFLISSSKRRRIQQQLLIFVWTPPPPLTTKSPPLNSVFPSDCYLSTVPSNPFPSISLQPLSLRSSKPSKPNPDHTTQSFNPLNSSTDFSPGSEHYPDHKILNFLYLSIHRHGFRY